MHCSQYHYLFSVDEDFVALPILPISFPIGSRAGSISCTSLFILDDDVPEPLEVFIVLVESRNEDAGIIVYYDTVTVTIEDDDGM